MLQRERLAEKIERWRDFWGWVMVCYVIIMFYFMPFLFIFSYPVVRLTGVQTAVQFLKLLARSGLWLTLLVTVALLFLNTLLAVAKVLLTGLTQEEKAFIRNCIILLLFYSMWLAVVTASIFASG